MQVLDQGGPGVGPLFLFSAHPFTTNIPSF